MLNCESCETLIVDSLYEELDAAQNARLQTHLASCASCRNILEEMQSAKNTLEQIGVDSHALDDIPERANLDGIWEKIQPELDKADAERFRQLSKRRTTPYVTAALAIAASVIVFFSLLPVSERPNAPVAVAEAPVQISPELMNYLMRAESMLLLVANAETESVDVVPVTSNFARDMALEANYLTASMGDDFNSGQSRLLRDIEFMLLQIANLDESNMAEGVALLQQYLEENSVLFKIRLLEMRDQSAII